jgi:hypothetical protein
MIRGRFRWDSESQSLIRIREPKRVQVHAVVQDTIDTYHHGLGRKFESRAEMDKALKESGFEEGAGKATKIERDRDAEIRDSAEKAYYMCKYGNSGLSEKERYECLEADRKLGLVK